MASASAGSAACGMVVPGFKPCGSLMNAAIQLPSMRSPARDRLGADLGRRWALDDPGAWHDVQPSSPSRSNPRLTSVPAVANPGTPGHWAGAVAQRDAMAMTTRILLMGDGAYRNAVELRLES